MGAPNAKAVCSYPCSITALKHNFPHQVGGGGQRTACEDRGAGPGWSVEDQEDWEH